jgi:tetratricopeptide (TPR) repeat protein
MSDLSLTDVRHLEAAQGWLGLNNWREANVEIANITSVLQSHPDVLQVRWAVQAAAKEWQLAAEVAEDFRKARPDSPFGFVHLAYALHELKRTREAEDVLLPVVEKFKDEYIIRYNLACYACQLGDFEAAWRWLEKSMGLTDPEEVKRMALNDPDLEPIRTRIKARWIKESGE